MRDQCHKLEGNGFPESRGKEGLPLTCLWARQLGEWDIDFCFAKSQRVQSWYMAIVWVNLFWHWVFQQLSNLLQTKGLLSNWVYLNPPPPQPSSVVSNFLLSIGLTGIPGSVGLPLFASIRVILLSFSISLSLSLAYIDGSATCPNFHLWHQDHRIRSYIAILSWNVFRILAGWVGQYWKWLPSIWLLFGLWLKQKIQSWFSSPGM